MYAVILHVSSVLPSSNSGLQSFQAVKSEEKCHRGYCNCWMLGLGHCRLLGLTCFDFK